MHSLEFRRDQFPGKYLDRAQTFSLGQFATVHVPSDQYLFRFGALAELPYCACGQSSEDRDRLLFECQLFANA